MTYKLMDKKLQLYNDRQDIINISDFPDNLTILSNTCIGGRLYHDYHQKFLSPTIDFYMEPDTFVKFCCNLKYYMDCEIIPLPNYKSDYLKDFGKIPYKKVFFSVVDYSYNYVAYLPSFKDEGCCPEATKPSINKIGKYIVEEDGFDLDKFICNK